MKFSVASGRSWAVAAVVCAGLVAPAIGAPAMVEPAFAVPAASELSGESGMATEVGDDMVDPYTLELLTDRADDDEPVDENGDENGDQHADEGGHEAGDETAAAPPSHARAFSAGPAPVGIPHGIDLAVMTPANADAARALRDEAGLRGVVDALSDYWVGATDGAISEITVNGFATLSSAKSCSQYVDLWSEAAAHFGDATKGSAYTRSQGRHLVVIVPPGCGHTGYGTLADNTGVAGTDFGGMIFVQDSLNLLDVFAHEFGHNLGLMHSNLHRCPAAAAGTAAARVMEGMPGASRATFSDGCSDRDYGDTFDVMGTSWVHYGEVNASPAALSATQATRMNVMPATAIRSVELGAGETSTTVQIELASAGGTGEHAVDGAIRTAVITDPISGQDYYLENRDGRGHDAQTLYSRGVLGYAGALPGVRMLTMRDGGYSVALSKPDSSIIYGYQQSFRAKQVLTSHSGGVSVTVLGIDATTGVATVKVNVRSVVPASEQVPVSSSVPSVGGASVGGGILTAEPGTWAAGTQFSYQWYNNVGTALSGETAATFSLGDGLTGKVFSVAVTGGKAGFAAVTKKSAESLPVLQAATPVISGLAEIGSTLSAAVGTWSSDVALSRQWYAGGTAIPGATATTLTLGTGQIGQQITVRVTGAKTGYPAMVRESLPTSAVPSTVSATAIIASNPPIGATLRAPAPSGPFAVVPTGYELAYQWFTGTEAGAAAGGYTAIAGATGSSYVVPNGTWSGVSFFAELTLRPAVPVVDAEDPLPRAAEIRGSAQVGQTLTAVATGGSAAKKSYQWFADGVKLNGATSETFAIAKVRVGKKITVKVTWLDPTPKTVTSAATAKIAVAAVPTIAGVSATGATLTAKPGTWTASTRFSYQWRTADGPIPGATKASYLVAADKLDAELSVVVTGTRAGFQTVVMESARTAPILLPLVTVKPKIAGAAKEGRVLTANPGAWGPAGVELRYQWSIGSTAIAGATGRTFTVPTGHRGKKVTVIVTGEKPGHVLARVASAPTAKIVK